jgi:acyl-CoA synthetase (NDP forming)/GNAT superfamily N-acetyltransferase
VAANARPGLNAHKPDPGCEALTATGAVIRLRPVTPSDADALRALNARTSDDNLYLRFFGSSRTAADRDVDRLVRPDSDDHGVLVALLADLLIGVASYERVAEGDGEVAMLVDDAHHGQGIGTLLLEHLASLARRNGIGRFVGETLARNHSMLDVFRSSGLERSQAYSSGVVDVRLVTSPDALALDVIDERERLAEQRSLAPLFSPRAIAVIGSGQAGGVDDDVVHRLLAGGFRGPILPINPGATALAGRPGLTTLDGADHRIDLAVVAVPTAQVDAVVDACGTHGVRVVVVVSSYAVESTDPQPPSRRSLLRIARRHGVRVVGPGCTGVINANSAVYIDASPAGVAPPSGGIALASQSGPVGDASLEHAVRSGAGIAAFVSLGDKIDISGNDMLLVWDRDPQVDVVALCLESVGNPRKFARFAHRIARHKPVLLLMGGAAGDAAAVPFTGIISVGTPEELIEVAMLLADQPLPAGGRVGMVSNAADAASLVADAAARVGLDLTPLTSNLRAELQVTLPMAALTSAVDLSATADATAYRVALQIVIASGEVDSVLAVVGTAPVGPRREILAVLAEAAKTSPIPVLAVVLDTDGGEPHQPSTTSRQRLPVFGALEPAVRALAHAVRYARWRRTRLEGLAELGDLDLEPVTDGPDPDLRRLRT